MRNPFWGPAKESNKRLYNMILPCKLVQIIRKNNYTGVWTIPILWDLNMLMVLTRFNADLSPARILWIVLWIVQYVPVLPIPALRESVSDKCTNDLRSIIMEFLDLYKHELMSWTCSAPQLGQDWVVHGMFFLKFHAQQLCHLELHDRAIQDTEYVEQTWVPPLTAI